MLTYVSDCGKEFEVHRGANESLAFPVSPTGGLQHNQKNFSWMGERS
jgi:hypothetical protein